MTKILIDTNIFLDVYRSNKDTIDVFEDIEKIKTKLVLPQQIYDEFLRNRDQILRTLIQDIKNANQNGMHLTPLIQHLAEYESLSDAKRELSQINNTIIQKIKEMISDPTKDPIFSRFTKLYKSKEVTTIEKSDTLIKKAHLRKLCGNPPVSQQKDTIGDEIIWESVLEHIDDDLILVTRDGTYEAHSTFLTEEYRERTGKSLSIFDKMSAALKKVGEAPSDKLVQFEEEQKKYLLNYLLYDPAVYERLSRACTIDPAILERLSRACTIDPAILERLNNLSVGMASTSQEESDDGDEPQSEGSDEQ